MPPTRKSNLWGNQISLIPGKTILKLLVEMFSFTAGVRQSAYIVLYKIKIRKRTLFG